MHDSHDGELPGWMANLWAKISEQPTAPKPAPEACRKCGADVEYIASLGEWRLGYCHSCEPRRVENELNVARAEVVRLRVERDAGGLKNSVHPRRELLEPIESWLKHGRPGGYWLCLHGQNGTGKTTQLAALLWAHHRRQVWASTRELAEDWQAQKGVLESYCRDTRVTYTTERDLVASTMPSAPERRSIEWWSRQPFLMIDEVGRETRPSEYTCQTLWALYDARYQRQNLTTVLCSNYHPTEELSMRSAVWSDVTLASRLLERLGGSRLQGAVSFEDQPNWRLSEGGW